MLHKAIKIIREYNNLSISEIAKLLKYDPNLVSRFEEMRANLNLSHLQAYSDVLNIPVSGIVYISERIRDKRTAIELTRCTERNQSVVVGEQVIYHNSKVQDILNYINESTAEIH